MTSVLVTKHLGGLRPIDEPGQQVRREVLDMLGMGAAA